MFAVAQRSGVHGLWRIYYLHNSDTDSIYFLFVPSDIPHFVTPRVSLLKSLRAGPGLLMYANAI